MVIGRKKRFETKVCLWLTYIFLLKAMSCSTVIQNWYYLYSLIRDSFLSIRLRWSTFKSVPATNQYWVMGVMFLGQGNDASAFDRIWPHDWQASSNWLTDVLTTAPCHPSIWCLQRLKVIGKLYCWVIKTFFFIEQLNYSSLISK